MQASPGVAGSERHPLAVSHRLALAGHPRALRPLYHLLQPLCPLGEGRGVGQDIVRDIGGLRWGGGDDRQFLHAGASTRGHSLKKGGADHGMGRSRGGLTSKLHAVVDGRGRPIRMLLTPGQTHDAKPALALLAGLPEGALLLADRAYDSNAIRALSERGIVVNIPPKRNRRAMIPFDRPAYRKRNLVERFFNRLKQFRGIATRYDKLERTFMDGVKLAAIRIWLKEI